MSKHSIFQPRVKFQLSNFLHARFNLVMLSKHIFAASRGQAAVSLLVLLLQSVGR